MKNLNPLRFLALLTALLLFTSTARAVTLVAAPQIPTPNEFVGATGNKGDGSVYVEMTPLPRAYVVLGGAVGIESTPRLVRFTPRAGGTLSIKLRKDFDVIATSFGTLKRQMLVFYADGMLQVIDRDSFSVARDWQFSYTSWTVVKAMYHEPSGRLFAIIHDSGNTLFWKEWDISPVYDLTKPWPYQTQGGSGTINVSCAGLTWDGCQAKAESLRLLDMSTATERRYLVYGAGQSVIRPASGTAVQIPSNTVYNGIPVNEFIRAAVYDPAGNRFLAAAQTDNVHSGGNLFIYNLGTNAITRHWLGGTTSPDRDIVFDPRTKRSVVTVWGDDKFYVTDVSNGTTTPFSATKPYAVALNTMTNRAYVLQSGGGSGGAFVNDCDLANVTCTLSGFQAPVMFNGDVAIDPVSNLMYAMNRGQFPPATLLVFGIDANTISSPISTGPVSSVAVDAKRGDTWLLDSGAARIHRMPFPWPFLVATTPTGLTPRSPVADPVTGEAYVANQGGNSVTVLKADGGPKTTFGVCAAPSLLAHDSNAGVLYVACTDTVKAYRTSDLTEIGSKTGTGPVRALHFDRRRRLLYVATDTHVRFMRGIAGQNLEIHSINAPAPGLALASAHDSVLLLAGAEGQAANVYRITDSFATSFVSAAGTLGSGYKGMVTVTSDFSDTFGLYNLSQGNTFDGRPWTTVFVSNGSENAVHVRAQLTWDGNGMPFSTPRTVSVPGTIRELVADTASGRAYAPLFTSGLAMIDGAASSYGWIPVRWCGSRTCTPDGPTTAAVDSTRHRITTGNAMSGTASVVDARGLVYFWAPPYITTTFSEFTNHTAPSANPDITLTTQANTSPNDLPTAVWFQVDALRGAWTPAEKSGNNTWVAKLRNLSPGTHTIYAYAMDANVRALDNGRDPLVGELKSYTFFVPCTPLQPRGIHANETLFCDGQAVQITDYVDGFQRLPSDTVVQWYKEGVALTDDGVYSGTRTRTLSFTASQATAGGYSARYVNSCNGSTQSNTEEITIGCP